MFWHRLVDRFGTLGKRVLYDASLGALPNRSHSLNRQDGTVPRKPKT